MMIVLYCTMGHFELKICKKKIPPPFSGQSKFLIIKFNCDNFWNFSTPTYLSGQACRFFLMKRREPQMVTISLCAFLINYSPLVYIGPCRQPHKDSERRKFVCGQTTPSFKSFGKYYGASSRENSSRKILLSEPSRFQWTYQLSKRQRGEDHRSFINGRCPKVVSQIATIQQSRLDHTSIFQC